MSGVEHVVSVIITAVVLSEWLVVTSIIKTYASPQTCLLLKKKNTDHFGGTFRLYILFSCQAVAMNVCVLCGCACPPVNLCVVCAGCKHRGSTWCSLFEPRQKNICGVTQTRTRIEMI